MRIDTNILGLNIESNINYDWKSRHICEFCLAGFGRKKQLVEHIKFECLESGKTIVSRFFNFKETK